MPKSKYANISKTDIYRTSISTAELKAIRRTLAKRVNQRLVRLERATSEVTGESLANIWAGERISKELERLGRNRFAEQLSPKDYTRRDIQAEIIKLKTFLDYKSSTVAGAQKTERQRLAAFEKKGLGSVAREREFYDFINSGAYKSLVKSTLTSEQIQDFYNRKYTEGATGEEIQAMFDEYLEQVDRSPTGEITYKGLMKSLGIKKGMR